MSPLEKIAGLQGLNWYDGVRQKPDGSAFGPKYEANAGIAILIRSNGGRID